MAPFLAPVRSSASSMMRRSSSAAEAAWRASSSVCNMICNYAIFVEFLQQSPCPSGYLRPAHRLLSETGTMKLNVHIRSRQGTVQAFCPDLPGCSASAQTEKEAITLLRARVDEYFAARVR